MLNGKYYAAITLGPIYETLNLATSPAGLWAASGLFSCIAEVICRTITEKGGEIINPGFPESCTGKDSLTLQDKGVGLFHDRIFFTCSAAGANDIEKWIADAKKAAAETTADMIKGSYAGTEFDKGFEDLLEQFVQLHYVICEQDTLAGKNVIYELSPYLDALEFVAPYEGCKDRSMFLKRFFNGTKDAKSVYIRESKMVPLVGNTDYCKLFDVEEKSQNVMRHEIRDLEDIADAGHRWKSDKLKRHRYFAVVKSDGDGMGKTLKYVIGGNKDKLNTFSSACRDYLEKACKAVTKFGGMVIYAGGDDMLFLSPISYAEDGGPERSLLELLDILRTLFEDSFTEVRKLIGTYNANRSEGDEYVAPPSVSFGVSMNYYKYPLNEAREEAEKNLLYGAKNIKGKDATVLTIRKGSGQQAKFAWKYGSPVQTEIKKFITDALSSTDPAEKTKALHSVIYHMRGEKRITQGLLYDETENAKSVYQIVIEDAARRGEEALGHAFDNLFDSDVQKQAGDYLEDIRKALLEFEKEENRAALEIVESQPYDLIVQMLWFAKFYTEKSGKEN